VGLWRLLLFFFIRFFREINVLFTIILYSVLFFCSFSSSFSLCGFLISFFFFNWFSWGFIFFREINVLFTIILYSVLFFCSFSSSFSFRSFLICFFFLNWFSSFLFIIFSWFRCCILLSLFSSNHFINWLNLSRLLCNIYWLLFRCFRLISI